MTDREIERLIWLVLQYEGSLPPMTEETVAYWEEKMKDEPPVELPESLKDPNVLWERMRRNEN